jgi:hypothetical protein
MTNKAIWVAAFSLALVLPSFAKGKQGQRAMIEKMEAVPCGAKEHGVTGLGSVWASVGITSVNSDEKMCPQYLLKTDDMEYHVRPLDHKHPRLLPIGREGEFKIDKDVLEMRIPEGDHKLRRYQVVAMKPIDHPEGTEVGAKDKEYEKPQIGTNDKPTAQIPTNRPY